MSDAPEASARPGSPYQDAPSYTEALELWRDAEDVNAWIGARFRYDPARALLLSETARAASARAVAVTEPSSFFAWPSGVCVDLARFGVEALRSVAPLSLPRYLMIEFDPLQLSGHTLRRHWLTVFEREGQRYFFADSKRPGVLVGPYPDTASFIADYARYRGRTIVAWRELESTQRAPRQVRPLRLQAATGAPARP